MLPSLYTTGNLQIKLARFVHCTSFISGPCDSKYKKKRCNFKITASSFSFEGADQMKRWKVCTIEQALMLIWWFLDVQTVSGAQSEVFWSLAVLAAFFLLKDLKKFGSDPILCLSFLYMTASYVSVLDASTYSAALVTFFSMLLINSPWGRTSFSH